MSHLSWEYKLTMFCGLCSVILCILLGVEWWYGKHFREQLLNDILKVNKAGFEMQSIPNYQSSESNLEQYADFIKRPIVFEERKPIAKILEQSTNPVAETPKGEFGLTLTGIIKTPNGGIKALFQNPTPKSPADKNKRLSKGEEFDGWKLIDIQSDRVSIQMDDEIKEIPLLKSKPKTPAIIINTQVNPFAPPNMNTNAPQPMIPPLPGAPIPANPNPFLLKH